MLPCLLLALLATLPQPLPGNPGNVFLSGQEAIITVPDEAMQMDGAWRALDDQWDVAASGAFAGGDERVNAGALPVGWYRIEFRDNTDELLAYTTTAVLDELRARPPEDTPVALDVALSWVPPEDIGAWPEWTRLAALAGVRSVRDRLRWRDVQPEPETIAEETKYDDAAQLQRDEGFQVLQVFHDTPPWAVRENAQPGRMPADLRDTHRFAKAMAERFSGLVTAWQAWNEPNSGNFGGHTIDEIASHHKAAYLGFKAGDPDVTVTWTPFGGTSSELLSDGVIRNAAWPYFDVYAFHSYDWPHDFDGLWGPDIDAASGRPIWVTEADRGLSADPDCEHGDFAPADARRKAEFMAQSIASSLGAGAARHFHFILPNYTEGDIQFGLLRSDGTPRMSYVAWAAAGRFLAGARCLGRWVIADRDDVYVYAFRGEPDGEPRDVLIAWTEERVDWRSRGQAESEWPLPADLAIERVYDYLGRSVGEAAPARLRSAPVYVVMPEGEADRLQDMADNAEWRAAPESPWRDGDASPVVLQLHAPDAAIVGREIDWAPMHDYALAPGEHEIAMRAYNFGDEIVSGAVEVAELPSGWNVAPASWKVELQPMERHEQRLQLTIPEPIAADGAWVSFEGAFNGEPDTRLAFRVLPRQ